MSKPSVKILVGYHKPTVLVKNSIIVPIHLGRVFGTQASKDGRMSAADYRWMTDNMIGDDTGDNISNLNRDFSEMTAHYWMWKNYDKLGNPDYIGFMHYRRFFIFNENLFDISKLKPWVKGISCYKINNFDKACEENIQENNIDNLLSSKDDVYTIYKHDITQISDNDLYMKEHYLDSIPFASRKIWALFFNTVIKLYPDYEDVLKQFSYGHYMYCFNMFIMKKDLFKEYCEFTFNIMNKIFEDSFQNSDRIAPRHMGFLAEYITTLFLLKLEQRGCKIKHLNTIFIENPENSKDSQTVVCQKKLKFFSINEKPTHKEIQILGIKIKLKKKRKIDTIANWENLEKRLSRLENKISDLQEEIITRHH